MRKRWICLLAAVLVLGGCQKKHPPTSGGRTASYWAEVLQKPDPDVALRRKAALKIGPLLLMDDAVVPALLTALKDSDAEVRSSAARSLGIYSGKKGPEVLPALRDLQDDNDAKVREAVAKAVQRLSDQK
jgi:HEAT repeat protein